ncbi:hypothetical protein HZA87_00165 [Candidatus Uhrbacteria bacterium]|nr:hypothetical protein [Candidatus Uhrbacteria bacterium]
MAGRSTSRKNWSVAAVVAIVFVASVFVLLHSAPEEVAAVSQDGLVRASGLTRSSGSLVIERIDDVETSVKTASAVYEVSLTGNGHLNDGELVMKVEDSASLSDLVLYTFHRETLSWIALPTLFDFADSILSTSLEFTGSLLIVAGERE